MTIYNDGAGNFFLGDCIYSNSRVDYPNVPFLSTGSLYGNIASNLDELCTDAGLLFRDILPQADWDNGATGAYGSSMIAFSASSDTIDDRYTFNRNLFFSASSNTSPGHVAMYNDLGFSGVNAHTAFTSNPNAVLELRGWNSIGASASTGASVSGYGFNSSQNSSIYSYIYVTGFCDGESLALCFYQHKLDNNTYNLRFLYAGQLADVNTNSSYYSANKMTSSILLAGGNPAPFVVESQSVIGVAHRISEQAKLTLQTGDAQYPITCSDGQNPTSQWATDMYVFDNDAGRGYPAMGRVRNLMLAQGVYEIGKPVKIDGLVQPDSGFNRWLPVGTYAGKVVLMRCYSSVSL